MALHPIIWVIMSLCILIYMITIQKALKIWIYISQCSKEIFRSFLHKDSSLWNNLPPWVKESTSLNDFKHNDRLITGWLLPDLSPFYKFAYSFTLSITVSCLFVASLIYSGPKHLIFIMILLVSYFCLWLCLHVFCINIFTLYQDTMEEQFT